MSDLKMPYLNKTLLSGNLVKDPVPGSTARSKRFCKFNLATSRKYGSNGQYEEKLFTTIVVWEDLADKVVDTLKKGDPVIVEGKLIYGQWTDKKTQTQRSKVEVTAYRIQSFSWDGGPPTKKPDEEPIPEDDIPF